MAVDHPERGAEEARPSIVRPYTLTGGRTHASVELAVETRISATGRGEYSARGNPLATTILESAHSGTSVAELSALLSQPLGVIRVVLGDLIDAGAVSVEQTLTEGTSASERRNLIERTLRGLREL